MRPQPSVSVIIATYNQARYLEETLESVLNQTLPRADYEVIVINDGSTDSTHELLRKYGGRVLLIEQENRGLVKSCNTGLARARGKYIVRVDSDDTIDPNLLQIEKKALDQNESACCAYSDRYEMNNGKRKRTIKVGTGNIYDLIACGVMFPTERVREVGGYRSFYWEEYDLYLRLAEKGDFIHIPIPLYSYRRHDGNMTNNEQKKRNGWLELIKEWGVGKVKILGHHPDLGKVIYEK